MGGYGRCHKFDYGFFEKPKFVRHAEEQEILRLQNKERAKADLGAILHGCIDKATDEAKDLKTLLGL